MNILVTLDKNYLGPLKVLLGSLFLNNPREHFDIYLLSDNMEDSEVEKLSIFCKNETNSCLHAVAIPEELFADAPIVRYYTRAMYYRLLAADLLPESLDRILYLDPDILVLGEVRTFYELDLSNKLFAAATHSGLTGISDYVNKLRLSSYESIGYYNSGVLLMNLSLMRTQMHASDIFSYVKEHQDRLILPDQDVLNSLYGAQIMKVDDSIWNYDARWFEKYRFNSQGEKDMDWVMDHTVFLHFCGKSKPWEKNYTGHFSSLYKHYQRLLSRIYPTYF
ncbi:MAG: glycosyltransferase family 8 protein [Bacillaceae bacterium]